MALWALPLAIATSYLVVLLIAMLIGRRLVLWYWQINRITRALEDIALSLRFLPGRAQHDQMKRAQQVRKVP